MKLIVTGGRKYHLNDADRKILDLIHRQFKVSCVLVRRGGGADASAENWARSRIIRIQGYAAQFKTLKHAAESARDAEMIKQADAVAVFPGHKSTKQLLHMAHAAGKVVFDFMDHTPETLLECLDIATLHRSKFLEYPQQLMELAKEFLVTRRASYPQFNNTNAETLLGLIITHLSLAGQSQGVMMMMYEFLCYVDQRRFANSRFLPSLETPEVFINGRSRENQTAVKASQAQADDATGLADQHRLDNVESSL